MSFLLYTNEANDEAIDLGDPFDLMKSFKEISLAVKSEKGWDELLSVPQFGEQNVEAAWLAKVKEQAAKFMKLPRKRQKVGDNARAILLELAK